MLDFIKEYPGLIGMAVVIVIVAGVVGRHMRLKAEALARGWMEGEGLRPVLIRRAFWQRANPRYLLKVSNSQTVLLVRGLDDAGRTHEAVLLLGSFLFGTLQEQVEVLERRILPSTSA